MKVLIVGSGGREHALAWKIADSNDIEELYCAPGNPGIAEHAICVPFEAKDIDGIVEWAKDTGIDLVVVGPEDPLASGIVDRLNVAGIKAFGPSGKAAILEASKSFTKDLMRRYEIPSAAYAEFTDPEEARAYLKQQGVPIVIKADGLAAGKGVTVAHTLDEALAAINRIMVDKDFGAAGEKVIIEECMVGEEASILAFTDGETVIPLEPSQDHKPVYDNDEGPNTGGMGAYSPAPVVDAAMLTEIEERILIPCVRAMKEEGRKYKGILYAGLMITADGPKVVEFNCRFGDPEAQVVLPRMKSDILPLMLACCDGTLADHTIEWDPRPCVSVVMASGGYPGGYEKGKQIAGIKEAEAGGAIVFQAGTADKDGAIVTAGGRVLNVTALGDTIPNAISNAYAAVEKIRFEGAHYRKDIGRKAVKRLA